MLDPVADRLSSSARCGVSRDEEEVFVERRFVMTMTSVRLCHGDAQQWVIGHSLVLLVSGLPSLGGRCFGIRVLTMSRADCTEVLRRALGSPDGLMTAADFMEGEGARGAR